MTWAIMGASMRAVLRFFRFLLAVALGGAGAFGALRLGHALLAPSAPALLRAEASAQRAAALGAISWGPASKDDFGTGAELFDHEWAFGAPMMRTACLAQVILRHRMLDSELGPHLDDAVKELLSEKSRAFTKMQWGSDPLGPNAGSHDHGAYLGYTGFALGLAARAHPDKWTEQRRDVVGRLRARVLARADRWIETYPDQAYPPDMSAMAGALALDREDARDEDPALTRALDWLRGAIDPDSGLLIQSIHPETGAAIDRARGSGTFMAVYFLLPADVELAKRLYDGGRALGGEGLSFMGMREYPRGTQGAGDVDSGPVLFGFGVSASGFALAGARAFGDDRAFLELQKTADLFGVPYKHENGGTRHIAGGPLGDAILCAMETALSPEEWASRGGAP